jgi:hypothetical protein
LICRSSDDRRRGFEWMRLRFACVCSKPQAFWKPDCGNWMHAAFGALRAALAPKASRRTRMHWNQAKAAYIVPRLNLETLMQV